MSNQAIQGLLWKNFGGIPGTKDTLEELDVLIDGPYIRKAKKPVTCI